MKVKICRNTLACSKTRRNELSSGFPFLSPEPGIGSRSLERNPNLTPLLSFEKNSSNSINIVKGYGYFINHDSAFYTLHFLKRQKYPCNVRLIKSRANCCFLDICIWFDRVWQTLQQYKYSENSDPVFITKLEENQSD